MDKQKNSYGYEDVDDVMKETSGAGKYLNFKKGDKGRIIQIRLCSEPRYVQQHWVSDISGKKSPVNCEGAECVYCNDNNIPRSEDPRKKTAKWGWIVIDREDEQVKVFTGASQIARAIKDISELINIKTKNVVWGNPLTYDIQIERTEEPGAGYYKVTPMVEGKGELTEEEKKKVADAGFDLMEEIKGGKKSENTGNYAGAKDLETAPEDQVNPEEIPTNLGEESSEDVNPDDIPF